MRRDGTRKLRSGATPRLITREENDENNEILTRGRPTCPKRLLTEHSYARNTAPVQRILRDISNTPQVGLLYCNSVSVFFQETKTDLQSPAIT